MTLDEMRAGADTWKQAVGDEMADLTPERRREKGREAVEWLECQLGRRLPRPVTDTSSA